MSNKNNKHVFRTLYINHHNYSSSPSTSLRINYVKRSREVWSFKPVLNLSKGSPPTP